MSTGKKASRNIWLTKSGLAARSSDIVVLLESGVAAFVWLVQLVGIKNKN